MTTAALRLPGFVNVHSHAFQRGMRGVVERVDHAHRSDDFWTWREAMYAAAGRLDPDSMHAVALLAYREMTAAGYVAAMVIPARSPKYAFAAPRTTVIQRPSNTARSVSSRICRCSGTNGLNGRVCVLMEALCCHCTRVPGSER